MLLMWLKSQGAMVASKLQQEPWNNFCLLPCCVLWTDSSFHLCLAQCQRNTWLLALILGFLHYSLLLSKRFGEIKVVKIQCKILMLNTAKFFKTKLSFLLSSSGLKADVSGFAFWDPLKSPRLSCPSIKRSFSRGTVCIS